MEDRLAEAGVTRRESQVLLLLPERLANADIAARLFISERTVESHVSSLLRKFGVSKRSELTDLVLSWPEYAALRRSSAGWRSARFVGRKTELDVLADELTETERGGFRCVLVTGEPGVGKTRLSSEFLARHAHVPALSARAFPLGSTTSLALWVDALEGRLKQMPLPEVRQLCSPWLDDLATVLPTAAEARGSVPADKAPQRLAVDLIGRLVQRLASEPLLLVFDDAHLADGSSWEALEQLANDLARRPVLVVITARPAELAEHRTASDVLIRLERENLLRRLVMRPLEPEELARLAAAVLDHDVVPAQLVEWLMARSWGNPLYAVGLLQALVDEEADLNAPELERLPQSLGECIQARLRDLDTPAAGILEILAVIGRTAAAGELVAVSQATLSSLLEPVEALVDAGLVTEREESRELSYEVTHPLLSEAVYQRMGGTRRRLLHRRVADHLRSTGRLAESCSHLARCAGPDDPELVPTFGEALRDAGERDAYQEAVAILGTLVEVLPRGDSRWLEVLDSLSDETQWVLDHRADVDTLPAIAAMQAVDAALTGSPDLVRRGTVKLRLASLYSWGTGNLAEAGPAASDALELFRAAGDKHRALLAEVELAAQLLVVGDFAGVQAVAGALLEAAEALDDPKLLMHVTGWLAVGRYFTGDFGEAEALFRRSATAAHEHGQAFHASWSLALLAISKAVGGTVTESRALLAEARSIHPRSEESLFHECATTAHWVAGDFAAAQDEVEKVLHWHGARLAKRRGFALPFGAAAAAEIGRSDTARGYLRTAAEVYDDSDFVIYRAFVGWAEAVVLGLDGRPAEAVPGALAAAQTALDRGSRSYAALFFTDAAELAGAAAQAGPWKEATAALEAICQALGNPFHQALHLLARACDPTDGGDGASNEAAEAAEVFAARGYPAYAGRAWHRLGLSLAGDEPDGARAAFGRAATAFEGCGAAIRRDWALRHLLG